MDQDHECMFFWRRQHLTSNYRRTVKGRRFPAGSIACIERNTSKIQSLKSKGILILKIDELTKHQFDLIILALKPKDALEATKQILIHAPNANIISTVAGITANKYPNTATIIRSMPNTASEFKKGITALYTKDINNSSFKKAIKFFEHIGHVLVMKDEAEMHSFTSVIGSGQGFLFKILEVYLTEFKKLSKGVDVSATEIFKNFVYSLGDQFNQDPDFDSLINKIKSPNGTTQAGIESLENNNVEMIIKEAFKAATNRSAEISNEN